jgi:hypothetical protein
MSPYTPYKLNRLEREMRNLRRWQYVGSAVIALSLGLLFANWIIGARAVKCTCDCHGRKGSQVSMFAGAPKPSVQPELFAKVRR